MTGTSVCVGGGVGTRDRGGEENGCTRKECGTSGKGRKRERKHSNIQVGREVCAKSRKGMAVGR